jgi:hypothetical protein
MAKGKDKKPTRNPSTGRTVKKTPTGDRAARINSLNNTMSRMQSDAERRTRALERQLEDATAKQRETARELGGSDELSAETVKEMHGVISSLGKAMGSFATGIGNITKDTAKASTDLVGQYGQAISQDININKQNTVAMALSTATPLFGYFASKFMETDVFKGAASRIKESVKDSLSKGISAVGGIIRPKKEEETEIPKMQAGGYVKQGGLAQVHAAEVIMPLEKVLREFSEARKPETDRMITAITGELKKMRMASKAEAVKMNKTLSELKVAMAGTVSQFRIAFQKFLLEHPMIKGMMQFAEIARAVFSTPLTFLFGIRGGYRGAAARAVRTSNVFLKSANMLQLMYGVWSPKFDHMIEILNAQLEYMSGEKIAKPKEEGTYTLFGKIQEFMTTRSIQSAGEAVFDNIVDSLDLDRAALAQVGITSIGDFLKPKFGQAGVSREMLAGKMREGPGGIKEGGITGTTASIVAGEKTIKEVAKEAMEDTKDRAKDIWSSVKDLFSTMKEGIPKAQKGGFVTKAGLASVHAAEVIASADIMGKINRNTRKAADFAQKQYTQGKERVKQAARSQTTQNAIKKGQEIGNKWAEQSVDIGKKTWKASKRTGEAIKSGSKKWVSSLKDLSGKITRFSRKLLKRMGSIFWKMIMFLGGFLGNIMKIGWRILTPIAGFLGSGILRMLAAGPKGILVGMGAMAGGLAAGAAGGAMMTVDAIRGFGKAKEWGTSRTAAVMGGGLAGVSEQGTFKGAAWGAAKGGLVGAAAGALFGGPIGMAIGGGIGALAGGILGFIGGKNVAKAIDWLGERIKKVAKGVWKIISFPIKMVWRIVKTLGKTFWKIGKVVVKPIMILAKIWWRLFKVPFKIIGKLVSSVANLLGINLSGGDGAWIKWVEKGLKILFFPLTLLANVFETIDKWITWADKKTENMDDVISDLISNIVTWPIRMFGRLVDNIRAWIKEKFGGILSFFGIDLFDPYVNEKKAGGGEFEKYRDNVNMAEANAEKARAEHTQALADSISKSVEEGNKQTVGAIVQNTAVMSNYNQNLANTVGGMGAGGGGREGGFGTGDGYTSGVVNGMA